jgi:hypothetical protein
MAVCSGLWHSSIVGNAPDFSPERYRGADPIVEETPVRRSSIARLLAASTAVALVIGGLSGCFLLPLTNSSSSSETSETPSDETVDADGAGACWDTNFDDLAAWSSWEGDGPVDCDEDHQSYTYLAEDLEVEVDEPFDSEGMTGELAAAVSDQCRGVLEDSLHITETEKRVNFFFFAPTESEWEDGSRAIRCDLGVFAFGSDYFNGDIELEDLPADIDDLLSDIDSDEVSYQLCLTGDGAGPYEGTEAIIEDCTVDYFWRFGGNLVYSGTTENDAYPEGDSLYNYAIDECPQLGIAGAESVYPYVPTQDSWTQLDEPSNAV